MVQKIWVVPLKISPSAPFTHIPSLPLPITSPPFILPCHFPLPYPPISIPYPPYPQLLQLQLPHPTYSLSLCLFSHFHPLLCPFLLPLPKPLPSDFSSHSLPALCFPFPSPSTTVPTPILLRLPSYITFLPTGPSLASGIPDISLVIKHS